MAYARIVLLAFVLALPFASAQQEPLDPVLTVEPLAAPIPPLKGVSVTPFHLDVLCEPEVPGSPREIHFWIQEAPEWVVASPSIIIAPMGSGCAGTRVGFDGELTVSVTDKAPASAPASVVLAASYESVRGNVTGTATFDVTASYFGILSVEVPESIKVARPGEEVKFPVRIENLGNAEGIVSFELGEVAEGLEVTLPAPVTLQSAQEGGAQTSGDAPVTIRAEQGRGYLNEVGIVTVRIVLTRVADAAPGDASSASFVITTRGLETPFPGAWAALALAGVAMARARRPAEKRRD